MIEVEKKIFDEVFDEVYNNMNYQKNNDPQYTINDLENMIKSLYVSQGNDWVGKGEVANTTLDATIAACENVLAEWKDELK